MSGAQTSGAELERCFLEVLEIVGKLGCSPFFGTALGLGRSGMLINFDDDIDLICPVESMDAATALIRKKFKVEIEVDIMDQSSGAGARSFILRFADGLVHLDLYAFLQSKNDCIFPVHWRDQRYKPDEWLHVPREIALAFAGWGTREFGVEERTRMANLCEYLYGENWQVPLRKNIDYIHSVELGRPLVRPSTILERLTGNLNLIYSNAYWGMRRICKKGGLSPGDK